MTGKNREKGIASARASTRFYIVYFFISVRALNHGLAVTRCCTTTVLFVYRFGLMNRKEGPRPGFRLAGGGSAAAEAAGLSFEVVSSQSESEIEGGSAVNDEDAGADAARGGGP